MLPRVATLGPRLMSWLARPRDRIEGPRLFAGTRFVGGAENANAVLASGDADDDFVLHHEWRERHRVILFGLADLHVPHWFPYPGVERDQMRVYRRHEQCVAEDGQAAIHKPAAAERAGTCGGAV